MLPPNAPNLAEKGKTPPDPATVEALLAMTRAEHEHQMSGGRTVKRWWSMSEWMNASPAGRRSLWIRLGVAIFITILLTWLTQYMVSHSGAGKAATGPGLGL